MARIACLLALLACFPVPALADIPPPPPAQGFKRVPFEIVMKLETEIPGYKFYTFSRMGIGGQETIQAELSLGTDQGVAVPSSSSPSVRTGVVAVPDEVMAELQTTENLAQRLSRDAADQLPASVVVYETRGTISDLPSSDPRTKVESVVTVSPDETAGVKFTVHETAAPASQTQGENAGNQPSTQSPLPLVIAGIAGALAAATLGFWFLRGKGLK